MKRAAFVDRLELVLPCSAELHTVLNAFKGDAFQTKGLHLQPVGVAIGLSMPMRLQRHRLPISCQNQCYAKFYIVIISAFPTRFKWQYLSHHSLWPMVVLRTTKWVSNTYRMS